MKQSVRSLSQRIRSAKSSLDNAEQSFKENRAMRGELDLMLAEAELKNLRRKKDLPWSWNRQMLAFCAACVIALAGFGGWLWARHGESSSAAQQFAPLKSSETLTLLKGKNAATTESLKPRDIDAEEDVDFRLAKERLQLSKQDLRQLVRQARVELGNSN